MDHNIAVHCTGVTKSYGAGSARVMALRGIELDVHTGELLMLVGPSGCGKTTLISVIAGILDQDQGACLIFDQEWKEMRPSAKTRYRGLHIGFVFQALNLLPTLTVAENVAEGTPIAGVVTEVYVTVGSAVQLGDPLFKLDDRHLQAELQVRRTALRVSKEQLSRLVSLPRREEIPLDEARVKEAEASLADVKNHLALAEGVKDRRAISEEELWRRRYAVQVAEAKLAQARAQLTLLKAGPWKPDIEVAKAEVAAAEAQVKATETEIERLTIRASVDGQVLQVKIRVGEFAQAGALETPLILLGNVDWLHVRVDIDENDAWRIHGDAAALAFVRGNRELKTPLMFVRTEPYIVPKRSLTGDSTERVDTRVLQIIYGFEGGDLPVYVGQQMDVFIEASPLDRDVLLSRMPQRSRPGVRRGES